MRSLKEKNGSTITKKIAEGLKGFTVLAGLNIGLLLATEQPADANSWSPSASQIQAITNSADLATQTATAVIASQGTPSLQTQTLFLIMQKLLDIKEPKELRKLYLSIQSETDRTVFYRFIALRRQLEISGHRVAIIAMCNQIDTLNKTYPALIDKQTKVTEELFAEQALATQAAVQFGENSSAHQFASEIVTSVETRLTAVNKQIEETTKSLVELTRKKKQAELNLLEILDPTRKPLQIEGAPGNPEFTPAGFIIIPPTTISIMALVIKQFYSEITPLPVQATELDNRLDEIEAELDEMLKELDRIPTKVNLFPNENTAEIEPRPESGDSDIIPDSEIDIGQNEKNSFGDFSIGIGAGYYRTPDSNIGIQNFNTDTSPLHRFDTALTGPAFEGSVKFTNDDLFARIYGGYSDLSGDETDTISSFTPGQLPTYIDISGTGGFGFNLNSRINADINYDAYSFGAEFGREIHFSDDALNVFYGGVIFRSSRTNYNFNLNTDFNGGTFFNTLNERIDETQVGLNFGLDATRLLGNNLFLTLGGNVGFLNTDADYLGSDCGDGSIATAGCDGTLFLNSGIRAGNESIDPFGGLKAALAVYAFCKDRKTEILAGTIIALVSKLKENCVEVSASAELDFVPATSVNRPTQIGAGQQINLDFDYIQKRTFKVGATLRF